jgi:hypothetical protein
MGKVAVLKALEMCPPHNKLLIMMDSKLVNGWLRQVGNW